MNAGLAEPARHVPPGDVTHTMNLLGIEFVMGPVTTVPRKVSEHFVLGAIDAMDGTFAPKVLDLFSGVGARALTVAHHRRDADVTAVEHCKDALIHAEANRTHRAQAGDPAIALIKADSSAIAPLQDLEGQGDLVMATPPRDPLPCEIRPDCARHQPDSTDGLQTIRAATTVAVSVLKPGGWYFVQHAEDQADAVASLLTESGLFDSLRCHRDRDNRPRWSCAMRTDKTTDKTAAQ